MSHLQVGVNPRDLGGHQSATKSPKSRICEATNRYTSRTLRALSQYWLMPAHPGQRLGPAGGIVYGYVLLSGMAPEAIQGAEELRAS